MSSKIVDRLISLHTAKFPQFRDTCIFGGACGGTLFGFHTMASDPDSSIFSFWLGGVAGFGLGAVAGTALAHTYPIAIMASGVHIYKYVTPKQLCPVQLK